jgi:hypothetical protein
MVTSEKKLHELTLKDVDTCIRKALKMKNPRNKYECLQCCIKLNKMLLGIEAAIVIL